jgi:hypothetical protein
MLRQNRPTQAVSGKQEVSSPSHFGGVRGCQAANFDGGGGTVGIGSFTDRPPAMTACSIRRLLERPAQLARHVARQKEADRTSAAYPN